MAGTRGVQLLLLAAACAGGASYVGAVAFAASDVKQIALVRNVTELEGFGGRLVWSRLNPRTERFMLMTRYRGRVSRVPVASRPGAFDVDLGPDTSGRTVAVYSRCQVKSVGPFDRRISRRCDLFLYDFAHRRERRLRRVSEAARSESQPSIWRDRIAFVSRRDRPRSASEGLGEVRVRSLDGRGAIRRFRGSDAPLDTEDEGPGVLSVDLRERRVVFAWRIGVERCRADEPAREPDPTGDTGSEHDELWLGNADGTQTLVQKGCGADPATAFLNPYLTSDALVYGAITNGVRWWVRRYNLASGQHAEARAMNGLRSYVRFGDTGWQSRGSGQTRIERVPALRLTRAASYPSASDVGPPTGTTHPPPAR